MAAGFDAVCAFVNDDLSKDTIEVLHEEGVEAIAMRCAGYNNVDLAAAFGRIMVMRVPGYSPYAVAEYTLGMLLTLNRSLHRAYNRVRDNNFSINGFLGFDLRGKTFGIIGTGKIGRVFAELLQGFGVRILGYDMYPSQEAAEKLHIEYVPLETLYRESDVISLHCPLTDATRAIINAKALARMKPGAILINTARGPLLDEAAVAEALHSGKLGGLGVDVLAKEPPAADNPLLHTPNTLITPHMAWATARSRQNIINLTAENILRWQQGTPVNVVNGVKE